MKKGTNNIIAIYKGSTVVNVILKGSSLIYSVVVNDYVRRVHADGGVVESIDCLSSKIIDLL